jgi:hypothetical protein
VRIRFRAPEAQCVRKRILRDAQDGLDLSEAARTPARGFVLSEIRA